MWPCWKARGWYLCVRLWAVFSEPACLCPLVTVVHPRHSTSIFPRTVAWYVRPYHLASSTWPKRLWILRSSIAKHFCCYQTLVEAHAWSQIILLGCSLFSSGFGKNLYIVGNSFLNAWHHLPKASKTCKFHCFSVSFNYDVNVFNM